MIAYGHIYECVASPSADKEPLSIKIKNKTSKSYIY